MYKDPWKNEAYRRLKVIRQRCNRKTHPMFAYYGGKGIKCLVSVEEFFQFFSTKPEGAWTVGRIDHSKDYTLDNIEWQTAAEQLKERNARCGLPKDPGFKIAIVRNNKEFVFNMQKDAAKFLGVSTAEITMILQGKYKKQKSYSARRIHG